MNLRLSPLPTAGALLLPFLVLTPLTAQTPISGVVTGTLGAGVYHATSSLSVPAGQTLTLAAGVILKLRNGQEFTVDGTLVANGTAGNPVIVTDLQDDSAGGDTNANGPSSGAPAAWRGIVFNPTSTGCVLHYTDVRYGGSGYISNFYCNNASPTLDHCTSRDNYTHGIELNGSSFPTLTSCTIANNGGYAINGVAVGALANFAGNAATGNGSGNYARVTVGAVTGSLTLTPAAMISGVFVFDTTLTIPSGAALTFAAGTVAKMRNSGVEITVGGTLTANGTTNAPVVITGLADDSVAGDTNLDGPSSASPTAWRGIVFQSTSTGCALHYADVRYGGAGYVANFDCQSTSPTLDHCTSRNNYSHGLELNGVSLPTVTNCTFTNNGGYAINGVPIGALAGFTGNTATGNSNNTGNFPRVTNGAVSGSMTVPAAATINGVVVFDTSVTVPLGSSLTFAPGVVAKMRNSGVEITVDGTLHVDGTAANPVVFTGLADDSAAGDTNGDGPGSATSTAWRGIVFNPSSTGCVLTYADARYGGAGYISNFHCNDATPTLDHCTSRNNYTHGLQLDAASRPIVRDCTFTNNGGYAIHGAAIAAVPGFTNNQASGNASGSFVRVTDGNVTGAVVIGSQACLGGALVLATGISVATGGDLTLQQGVIVKFQNAYEVTVAGALHARGSAYEPVVFTSLPDDEFGGDTNGNGPSTGSPTQWRGVTIAPTAAASQLEHVRIRFTGSGYVSALTSQSPLTTLRAVRADRAYSTGIVLADAANMVTDLVAWQCGNYGIQLTGGSFTLAHATCNGNSVGIRRENGWTGAIVNSISRGNTTDFGNFATAAQVQFSDGAFAGQNGNLSVDPQFVDAPNGDLHLLPTSPCLGAADLFTAFFTFEDADQNSRLLDHALVGVPLPDMGAYELAAWDMTVSGSSRPGTNVDYTVTGPAGLSIYAWGLRDGLFPIVPFGFFLAGSTATVMSGLVPTGTPYVLQVPSIPALAGLQFGVQTLTFPIGTFAVGNLTRLHQLLIRP